MKLFLIGLFYSKAVHKTHNNDAQVAYICIESL